MADRGKSQIVGHQVGPLQWTPAVALGLSLAGLLMVGGGYITELREHGRRIEAIEGQNLKRDELLQEIRASQSRIEGRMDQERSQNGNQNRSGR